jgi:hypothetical protein
VPGAQQKHIKQRARDQQAKLNVVPFFGNRKKCRSPRAGFKLMSKNE